MVWSSAIVHLAARSSEKSMRQQREVLAARPHFCCLHIAISCFVPQCVHTGNM
jgi:hypothetical protein